jgi:hypothetical protein
MSTTIELPIRIVEKESKVSLDDLLDTLKVSYTVTNCLRCGLITSSGYLTAEAERELALA